MADFDLILRGGTVHDGRGSAPRVADVAVKDGRVAAIGQVTGTATETIDATGLLVTPGLLWWFAADACRLAADERAEAAPADGLEEALRHESIRGGSVPAHG